jgi:hypothetical protein
MYQSPFGTCLVSPDALASVEALVSADAGASADTCSLGWLAGASDVCSVPVVGVPQATKEKAMASTSSTTITFFMFFPPIFFQLFNSG